MQTQQSCFHPLDKKSGEVTFSNGVWFYFNIERHRVAVFGSCITGMERVYLNDELVSEKRNLTSLSGRHTFAANGSEYFIIFEIENYLTGEFLCTLTQADQIKPIEIQTKCIKTDSLAKSIASGFGFGVGFGVTLALLVEIFGI